MAGAADVALNIVFMGPPGAGKGTQAERFAREHGIPKISTGDILRDAVTAGTALGQQVKALMDRGELVGDDLIIGDRQGPAGAGRTRRGASCSTAFRARCAQAEALDEMLTERGPVIVVEIQVPDEELVRRVVSRRICSTCGRTVSAFDGDGAAMPERARTAAATLVSRSDDSEAVVRDRLKVYWRETQPMIAFYHARPTYRAVNGAQAPERVRDALVAAVASALGKPASGVEAGDGRDRRRTRDCLPIGGGDRAARRESTSWWRGCWPSCKATVAPGVTTAESRRAGRTALAEAGAEPAFKGYHGYPATICASVNEQVVHGIPSNAAAGRRRHRLDRHGREARRVFW